MDRPAPQRYRRNRSRIAQTTARLIAEHGLTDWNAAKRKACRELGLAGCDALPDNEEVEQALRDYNSLFRQDEQPARLRAQRLEALRWMERLSEWKPVLTGAVAAGWATAHSAILLELEAEDAKAVELALINAGIEYGPAPSRPGRRAMAVQLRVENPQGELQLLIMSPAERRNRPRRERTVEVEDRLNLAQLRSLLAPREER